MSPLFAAETRAELAPFDVSEGPVSSWFPTFPTSRHPVCPLVPAERVGALLPMPVHVALPQDRGRRLTVAGFVATTVTAWPGRVAVTSTWMAVDEDDAPPAPNAARVALRARRAAERPGLLLPVAGRTGNFEGPPEMLKTRARFSDALDLRSLVDVAAGRGVIAAHRRGRESRFRVSAGATPRRGRLVVITEPPPAAPAASPSPEVRLEAHHGRLAGDEDPALLIAAVVTADDWRAIASELLTLLEHAVAHQWLLSRGRQLNDLQLNLVRSTLLNADASARELEQERYRLLSYRAEYLERVDRYWSYGLELPMSMRDAAEEVDRRARLSHLWNQESRRFTGIEGVADQAAGLPRSPRAPAAPEIPSEKERRTMEEPFHQVLHWWKTRNDRRAAQAEAGRNIELHPFENRSALFEELQVSIAMATFMTAASILFLGVILDDASERPRALFDAVGIDVFFLFIASFGFLFATLVYANLSGRLARHGTTHFERRIELANSVSEYLGVYPLLFALPLVVARYLDNNQIAWAVAGLSLLSLIGYHYTPNVSLLERDIGDRAIGTNRIRKRVIIPLLVVSTALMYSGRLTDLRPLELVGFGLVCLVVIAIFVFSLAAPERQEPTKYEVNTWDALGEERRSTSDRHWRERGGPRSRRWG